MTFSSQVSTNCVSAKGARLNDSVHTTSSLGLCAAMTLMFRNLGLGIQGKALLPTPFSQVSFGTLTCLVAIYMISEDQSPHDSSIRMVRRINSKPGSPKSCAEVRWRSLYHVGSLRTPKTSQHLLHCDFQSLKQSTSRNVFGVTTFFVVQPHPQQGR